MEFIFGSIFALIGAVIWLIPLIAIIASRRTEGAEKFAWILAVIFISWFAWIFYMLLAPLKQKNYRNSRHY